MTLACPFSLAMYRGVAPISLQTESGTAALHIVSDKGHTVSIALLLKANANPDVQTSEGCTPLLLASQKAHADAISLLLKANANPNLQSHNGLTPLYLASQNGHKKAITRLLTANANPNFKMKIRIGIGYLLQDRFHFERLGSAYSKSDSFFVSILTCQIERC